MPQFFLNKKLILLLVSIIILVALIGFSLRERDEITWPEQFIKDTVGWVENIIQKPVGFVAGFVDNLTDLQNTYDENEKLKSRLDEYVKLKTEVQSLKKENGELKDILKKEESLTAYHSIQATVIGRNPDQWHEYINLDKGKIHGIEKNMAVITSQGLIGKVKTVSQLTSTVQLLSSIDPKNRISATVQGNADAYGLIEGFDEEKGMLLWKRVPYDIEIKVGSNVITSGLGGVFPSGLPIGVVKEVEVDQYGLNQKAYIEPAADFYDINNVIVVESKFAEQKKELKKESEEEGDGGL